MADAGAFDAAAVAEANAFTISNEVADLAREAVWEFDAMARVLLDLIPRRAGDGNVHEVVRAFCGRFLRLSSVIQQALDGDPKDEGQLASMRNKVLLEGDGQG